MRLTAGMEGLTSPIDARGAAGFNAIPLRRRELFSFALRTLLSGSLLLSLLITSAKALLAKPRESRMELLVEGLPRLPPTADCEDLLIG